jgi:hypothetical protein
MFVMWEITMEKNFDYSRFSLVRFEQLGDRTEDAHCNFYRILETDTDKENFSEIASVYRDNTQLRHITHESIFSQRMVCNVLRVCAKNAGREFLEDDIVECITKEDQKKNADVKYYTCNIDCKSASLGKHAANLNIPIYTKDNGMGLEIDFDRFYNWYAPVIYNACQFNLPGIVPLPIKSIMEQIKIIPQRALCDKYTVILKDKYDKWEVRGIKENGCNRYYICYYRRNNYGKKLIEYDDFCKYPIYKSTG